MRRRGAGGGAAVQRSMRSARAAAESDAIYAQKAEEFEIGMGPVIAADSSANDGANLMLDAVKKIVDAYAQHTGKTKSETSRRSSAWAGGDKYYGAFLMTGESIKKVFDDHSQPLRKKLKIVYNAVRNNNVGKWLEVAVQEMMNKQAGKAAANINVHRTEGTSRDPDGSINGGAPYKNDEVTPGFARTRPGQGRQGARTSARPTPRSRRTSSTTATARTTSSPAPTRTARCSARTRTCAPPTRTAAARRTPASISPIRTR